MTKSISPISQTSCKEVNEAKIKFLSTTTDKINYNDDPANQIFVVRESKYFQNEWFDLKRPKCWKDGRAAQNYVESQIDEIEIKRMFDKNEEVKVERLASSMTWYYTIKTKEDLPIMRFEIYLTNLL